ncbi:MAG: hypothetical protein E7402_04465 [Ruminococcaceae bacterium]|nr:hypothetical protein [Oscillospiraceae bacterium]
MKKYLYSFGALLLGGVLCFLPSLYVSQNNYKIAGYMVAANHGDNSELEKFEKLSEFADICLVLGIILCAVAIVMLVVAIYKKIKSKSNDNNM